MARHSERWLADRKVSGIRSVRDEETRMAHALPHLGEIPIETVRPHHIRDLVRALKKGTLAPRTVRHVYGLLHTMFRDAQVEELVDSNPCVLRKGELPKMRDKDPTWRAGAVFAARARSADLGREPPVAGAAVRQH
ncbi:MAG: hypothetical protein HYV07_24995 [Deltaproteobacteria bacterium]|nr:hypothetical protein [Deltaproteobacteria bacterium]